MAMNKIFAFDYTVAFRTSAYYEYIELLTQISVISMIKL